MKHHDKPHYSQDLDWFPIRDYVWEEPGEFVLISIGDETDDPYVRSVVLANQNRQGQFVPMFTDIPYEGAKYFARVALPVRHHAKAA